MLADKYEKVIINLFPIHSPFNFEELNSFILSFFPRTCLFINSFTRFLGRKPEVSG
ncbi:MAG: hypothetical protein ACTSVI_05420 [Promethearchaeota archaeon]